MVGGWDSEEKMTLEFTGSLFDIISLKISWGEYTAWSMSMKRVSIDQLMTHDSRMSAIL